MRAILARACESFGQRTVNLRDNRPFARNPTPPMLDPALLRTHAADTAQRLRQTRGFSLDAPALEALEAERTATQEIGSASCRARVCEYVSVRVVAVS